MHDMRPRPVAVPKPSVPVSTRNVTIARGKKVRPESKEPLKKRRKKNQKVLFIGAGIVLALLAALFLYLAWLPAFRVSAVTAEGLHAPDVERIAREQLQGTYAFILPRNAIVAIPEEDMRAAILGTFADIEAISITAEGFNTLRVRALPRAEAFTWCGTAPDAGTSCFSANAEGLIFAPIDPTVASTSEALRVYGAIEGQEGESPVKAHIKDAGRIPEALRFVKALQTLGADVVSITLREDEADLRTIAGTRITYVLGREQEAAGIAASVFPQLALNDGSIQYVDLRFPGKAYFKRKGETAQ